MPWRIEMLGGLTVVQGDRRITRFQTQKTGALLAYLALHPAKGHSREAIAEMLWPDGDPLAIRNRLNQAVSSLRRQLHPPELGPGTVLVTDHHSIGINPKTVATDVQEFERDIALAAKAEYEEERLQYLALAVDRYKGELLETYYEDWLFSQRMHLADLYDKALQQLIRGHVARDNMDEAIEYGRRRLQIDPYDEAPYIVLMRLYLRAGRPKSALKQFEDLQRMLLQFADQPSDSAMNYKVRAEAMANDQLGDIEYDDDFYDPSERKPPDVSSIARPQYQSNLPRIVSSFIGRESELATLESYIEERGASLVSILGLGGFGKTRLAIEMGWRLLEKQQMGVYFVPFSGTETGDELLSELARNILPTQTNLVAPFDAVVEHLNTLSPCLVVLDNFEHLAESHGDLVVELLQRVPKLQVIVTTRIPLKVDGEVLISLAPLPVPSESVIDLRRLAENPAIALFVDRAQAVKPDFQLTERTAQAIVDLSRKLEGLPLALELAAGWARVLTPSQMLDQVSENVDNLASRRKDISPRHRSLRAAFDGSFALLDDSMRNVFLRMTVMSSGWDLPAAQHLCPREDADSAIQALEERSMIFSEPTDRAIRFAMLETIRAFGEGMVSPDLRSECKWLHAEYFLSFAERKVPEPVWLTEVAADYANCVSALKWFEENKRADSFARFAIALAPYWEASGLLADGREILTKTLAMGTLVDPLLHARAKAVAANLDWLTGDFETAIGRTNEALELFRTYDAKQDQIEAQFLLQMEAHRVGDYEEVRRWLLINLQIAKEMNDQVAEARGRLAIGNVAMEMGQLDEAQAAYEESLELGRQAQDADRIGSALTNLANLAIERGQTEAARTWIAEAIEQLTPGVHRWKTAMSLIVLGRLENELGNYMEAVHTLIRAHRTAPDEQLVVWRFLLQFGFTLVGLGHVKQAARIFGYFERYRERIGERHRGIEMKLYEKRAAQLREEMTPQIYDEQLDIGRNMSFEDIENFIYRVQRSF